MVSALLQGMLDLYVQGMQRAAVRFEAAGDTETATRLSELVLAVQSRWGTSPDSAKAGREPRSLQGAPPRDLSSPGQALPTAEDAYDCP